VEAVDPCAASYAAYTPTVICKCVVYPEACSANYEVLFATIHGISNVYPGTCSANYFGQISSESGKCNEYPTTSSSTYHIYDVMVIAGAIAHPTECTAVYTVGSPFVIGYCHVFATTCNADYICQTVEAGTIIYQAASILELYVSPYYEVSSGGIPNYKDMSKMPNEWLRKCNGMDYSNERKLYRKLTTEAYNKHGVCMTYYIVSYDTRYDKIWGEDNNRRFIRKFDIMCRFPLQTEEKMWNQFAILGMDNFSIFASKDHFRTASTYGHDLMAGNIGRGTFPIYVPKNGDVIQSKYNKYLYEVVTVKEEAMMVHLSKGYTWEFIIKPYMDEHLSVDPAATASLANVSPFIDVNDIFKVNQVAQADAAKTAYDPKSCERPAPNNGGW
jgi:hypothetical protein